MVETERENKSSESVSGNSYIKSLMSKSNMKHSDYRLEKYSYGDQSIPSFGKSGSFSGLNGLQFLNSQSFYSSGFCYLNESSNSRPITH